MAQRMVRKICPACKHQVDITPATLEMLGVSPGEAEDMKFYAGRGCSECNDTGFSGRTGIFEVMPISPTIERLILSGASSQDLKEQAVTEGMLTLRAAALDKLKKGITTVDEVLAQTCEELK